MKLPKNFDKVVEKFGKTVPDTQNYIEFDEKFLKFKPKAKFEFEPWWGVGENYSKEGFHIDLFRTDRVCAASIDGDYTYKKTHHVLHLLGKYEKYNNFYEAILKLNEGRFIRTSENTVLLHNINSYNQNDLGRFIVSLRAPTEMHIIPKSFDYFCENGVPEVVALHLSFIFNMIRVCPQLQSCHQAFNARDSFCIYKLMEFIAEGKNLWTNNHPREGFGGYGRWALQSHDQKHFKGKPWKDIEAFKETVVYGEVVKEFKREAVVKHVFKLMKEFKIEH